MSTTISQLPAGDTMPREPEHPVQDPLGPGLLDVLLILAERKWFILATALTGALICAAVALLLPVRFTATAVIMPPQQQQSVAAALLGQLGPIAGLAGRDLGIKTPGDLYIGILSGRTIADHLIQQFDLLKVYDEERVTDARKVLARRSGFATGKDSLIKISVEDRDPRRAAALANAYVSELYSQTNRLALTESAQRRLFFERQMETEKKSLADAETALRSTQERTGVLQVNSQVESVIQAMARLRAEIVSREVLLSSLKKAATLQNPEVIRQETELSSMREQLRKLEASSGDSQHIGDPVIPVSRLPKAGLAYVRALRDVKYHETLFELLSKQYEAARIDEAKDTPLIQVVDSAVPPEKKSWPPRAMLTIAGGLCFGLLACLLAILGRRFQDGAEAEKLQSLRRTLFTFRNGRSSAHPAA